MVADINAPPLSKYLDPLLLTVTVVSKNGSIILTEVAEIPPQMLFPLEIFKNYTISCFKGNNKICYNDLFSSFTQKNWKNFSDQFVIFNTWKIPWNWIAFSQNSFVVSPGLLYHLIRRDYGRLANEAFTSNPIVSSKQ